MNTFEWVLQLLLAVLSISLFLCCIRLYRGPSVPDRIVAFDVIATNAVCIFALYAMFSNSNALLDVAIVTTVLGFLGTLMLARYLEQARGRDS